MRHYKITYSRSLDDENPIIKEAFVTDRIFRRMKMLPWIHIIKKDIVHHVKKSLLKELLD